ncbi:hypothetical protein EJ419_05840 [Alloscardovia theropitheci]|uniref:DUF6892 domain-containing protein n=1 Tax=Alloscardovia theropitheci TaxID=2496842 RepID=A0A4R0QP09_9BIFI|nr:hypothetical protein [Alloscardovia theropitheci]TCD53952.1 hypothetical protein EJ419_05840 [Alloscardovia theropitheci]
MNKKERAQKWFSNIPNSELISMEAKIQICNKVAMRMVFIILGLLALELAVLYIIVGGEPLSKLAEFFNNIMQEGHTRNRYRGVALIELLVFSPLFIIPVTAAFIYKNRTLKSELAKRVTSMQNSATQYPPVASIHEKNNEAVLHFDNVNFKLAIIQVLMYDLHLLKPEFDIFDFAEQYKGEDIDTDSYTVIEPAMNFFKEMEIPKELAPYVETLYMDGGNDVYMNIIPQWDGEDNSFDLNQISLTELQQFPNLKKATVMSSNFDKVKEVFDTVNVEVELL